MNNIDFKLNSGIIPLDERHTQFHGHNEKGVNYCVISHFRKGTFIFEKIAHLATADLLSSNMTVKSDESSLGLDIDKCGD